MLTRGDGINCNQEKSVLSKTSRRVRLRNDPLVNINDMSYCLNNVSLALQINCSENHVKTGTITADN